MYVAMVPAKFGSDKTVALEFSAACAWELECEMEARGVEPLSSSLSAQTSTRLSGEKF
jgi:hypothetical protein